MKVTVTGGSGHLGSRLVRQLRAQGAEVRVSYRPGDPTDALYDLPDVEHRPADLLDAAAIARAIEGAEVVFHTAAMVVFDPALYERQMRTNIEGTRNVLDAVRQHGVRRLVHTSTVSALGIPPRGSLGDEATPFDWGRYRLGYYDSKRASEDLVLAAARDGLDAVVVQPGTMFGPDDFNHNAVTYVKVIERGPVAFAPPGSCCVVHVDDVARGQLLALEKGEAGETYILGGEPTRFTELFRMIADELGVRRVIAPVPRGVLVGAGKAGSRLRALGLPVPLTEGMTVAIASRLDYSSAKATRALGWAYRPAQDAVADAVRWYRHHMSKS